MRIEMIAQSPLVHGEFSDGIDLGNMMNFRHLPMIKDGKIYSVPVVSGNAIRGIMRRILARELVDTFDLKNRMGKNFDRFYIAVANGGNLDKNMDVGVDTNGIRGLRQAFPLLSVLGAALYKYMLPGMVNVGFAIPRCYELSTGTMRLSEMTQDIGLTRHIDKTIADAGEAKPMPYTVEAVIPGVKFDIDVTPALQITELELSCLNHGLSQIQYIGGKHSSGFGKVAINGYGNDELYCEWLKNPDNGDYLVNFAEEL